MVATETDPVRPVPYRARILNRSLTQARYRLLR
ncbi:hypothetical protein SUDANB70_01895 [Streptomyces sp. enrichment culture]